MAISVVHGGVQRYSTAVAAAETTAWKKGRLLAIDTLGKWAVADGTANSVTAAELTGLAFEDRVLSTSVGPYVTLTKVGAPTGEKASAIIDPAVVTLDQLESGVVFTAGDVLYCSTSGKVTISGGANGNAANALSAKIGVALSYAHAGDTTQQLTMYFCPQY